MAKKGHRGFGAVTSAGKGKNVTIVAVVDFPPVMIFPRVIMKPELARSPPGSIGQANKSGWITAELFECLFDHFFEAVQTS